MLQAQVANLVQEKRPILGQGPEPWVVADRARNAPVFPEYFGLEQLRRNAAAIHGQEAVIPTAAEFVTLSEDDFLPVPGFALDKDRMIHLGRPDDQAAHHFGFVRSADVLLTKSRGNAFRRRLPQQELQVLRRWSRPRRAAVSSLGSARARSCSNRSALTAMK